MKFFLRLLLLLLFPALSLTAQVPELVDLGLSVKWASCNLGATKPEETGDYYMWGESGRSIGINSLCDLPHHRTCRSAYGGSAL